MRAEASFAIPLVTLGGLLISTVATCLWAGEQPAAKTKKPHEDYLSRIAGHYGKLVRVALDVHGPQRTDLWLASVDIRRGGQYEAVRQESRRVYRTIHAPHGSTLYWDQPAVACAYVVSRMTGDSRYRDAADRYIKAFLKRGISRNGLFLWGNHVYNDVFEDRVAHIGSSWHEARPLPPAWEMFWAVAPESTERCIREIGRQHVKDKQSGRFCRHASTTSTAQPKGKPSGLPFLESGGIIVESLCWLAAKTGNKDPTLTDLALRVARYSYRHRDEKTGLLSNQPFQRRWDYGVSTTEVGLWAGCLLRAAADTGIDEFRAMARAAVAAYLRYGYDANGGKYFGALRIESGKPAFEAVATTPYRPGKYADVWEPLFPTHNYPMAMAEACVTLYGRNRDELFKQAILRWVGHVRASLPAQYPSAHNRDRKMILGAYAGQYGRCIHFLVRAAHVLKDRATLELARRVADDAMARLYVEDAGMFRSHPGQDSCDAVDGAGLLFLALIYLQTGEEPDALGFHF